MAIEDTEDPAMAGGMRAGELRIDLPGGFDAQIYFIGRIRTPWSLRAECPRQGDSVSGPICTIEVDPRWRDALKGIEGNERLQILYWMGQARRDLVLQTPRGQPPIGTFALRSPARPNPIASSFVSLLKIDQLTLTVRGLDCVDGTALVDIKPVYPRSGSVG
ncbi:MULTISPECIES: SAM-dependent methyltransferase [Xanthobacter]|uniref:SAM-dependent methyltransferase n=1 Tax=Xanthobacter TaxID=279 RepID=UPI001F33064A|nr:MULTISPECIES: SAM-dependent methyltransferase [unclassified Xanthobacter]